MRTMNETRRIGDRLPAALLLAGAVLLGGCDLGVNNPEVIGDEDLDDMRVVPALVSGAISDVYLAALGTNSGGGLFTGGALLTDELVSSGNNTSYIALTEGRPNDDEYDGTSRWAWSARARWTTEDAIRRISALYEKEGIDPAKDTTIAKLRLWAGEINRMMGDNFCHAVIDGGPLQDHIEFHKRAEAHLTQAITIGEAAAADSLVLQAYAERARTRLMTGDWAGAVQDAGRIRTDYLVELELSPNARVRNSLVWQVYQSGDMTTWGTPFADWARNMSDTTSAGDPRVAYRTAVDSLGNLVKGPDDRRPYFQVEKYTLSEDNVALVRGTEMRLIEAEAALVGGQWPVAVDKINEVRRFRNTLEGGDHELDPVSAANADEAWDLLMRERALEFFLEGRRLPDLRRWKAAGRSVSTTVVRREAIGQPADADVRRAVTDVPNLCLPISRDERLSNPNIS